MPAPPPRIRTATDVAEAFLARLDGSAFDAPLRLGGEISARVERWGRSVTGEHARLIVRLDPPDDGDAWRLAVLAAGRDVELVPIEQAIVDAGSERRDIEDEIARLERLLPALMRPGGTRRGQVVLSQDEAWELMTVTGAQLLAAGFDVRVPALSRRRPTASLRVFAEAASTSVVGANQLADVRWSAVFDDVELTAADIARLAKEARPLIRSGGRWVAIDRADLNEAAAALAERSKKTQLSGGEMLRLALGLEGSTLAGGISIGGEGWAADLLTAADKISSEPVLAPEGFVGELRSYQAEALAWLGFLDSVGLGGCLALDMGLGKTPTMLAQLLSGAGTGPALVIAPPAVVGNWTAEAARFTPDLRVVVHHGANRASPDEIASEVADADVVITTYGTAVRDVDAIAAVSWDRVILDEAQAIKNPANDTSQLLRRIPARTRIALTGTPIENGLGDLWSILDFTNPGLVGTRPQFIAALSRDSDSTRRGRGRDARAQRHPRLPPHEGRAGDRGGAARPDRRARPLRDDRRADRPVSGGARQVGHRRRSARGRRAAQGSDPRGDHRAQADLQPPDRVPTRRPTARRPFGQARPARGDRRHRVRRGGAGARVHPLRRVGAQARGAPHRAHRHPGRLLPRRPVAHRTRRADRRLPGPRGCRRAGALAQGRWHGVEPHRRESRRALRPLVEPRGRGPGATGRGASARPAR